MNTQNETIKIEWNKIPDNLKKYFEKKVEETSHFAVFPSSLIRPLILNSCPKEICSKCGKARERINNTKRPKLNSSTPYQGDEEWIHHGEGKSTLRTTQYIERETLGWTKCKCGEKFKPGIVLDPFMGSGTVGIVAKKLGRDFIGIDLSKAYCQISRDRIRATSVPLPL